MKKNPSLKYKIGLKTYIKEGRPVVEVSVSNSKCKKSAKVIGYKLEDYE